MPERQPAPDRRRPVVRTLHQPIQPATVRAVLGGREVVEEAEVVTLTDRTMVVEVREPMLALALSLATAIDVEVDLGGGAQVLSGEPGRRASDNPTSRRVEVVLHHTS